MTPHRLIFMGSPDFSLPALAALLEAGHDIAAVYCQPPRRSGRGHKEKPGPVHAFAQEQGLPVHTPVSLKDQAEQQTFLGFNADAAVVVAYGLLLPGAVLDAPRLGCFNVHASLLPRWRGAAPIERAILAGDEQTGVSIMQMDEGLDTGPVLLTGTMPITAQTTAQTLHGDLAELGSRLMVEALEGVAAGKLSGEPQAQDGVTYAAKLTKQEGRLDWRQPAAQLERQVRALNPRPGVWFENNGDRVKVLAVEMADNGVAGEEPGTVLDEGLAVACGEGALRLLKLQRAGKGPQAAAEFLRGYAVEKGCRLD